MDYRNTYKPIEEEIIFRPISRYITNKVKDTPWITPDLFTYLSLITGILGAYEIYTGNNIIAAILIFISFYFDKMDGDLARLRNIDDGYGTFMDGMFDIIAEILWILTISIQLNTNNPTTYIAMVGSIMFYYVRIMSKYYLENKRSTHSKSILSIFYYNRAKHIIITSLAVLLKQYMLYIVYLNMVFIYSLILIAKKLTENEKRRPIR